MNEALLKEIYYSDCGPIEKMKRTEDYERLTKEVEKYYDNLFKILDCEPTKWLDEICTLETLLEAEWGFISFRAGFDYAMRLLLETFGSDIYKTKK